MGLDSRASLTENIRYTNASELRILLLELPIFTE
jgi:hypothetical protein